MADKINIEDLLNQGKRIQISPQGTSMYPLLIQGRDQVVLERIDGTAGRRGDVVLYRRDEGILVLHRVFRHTEKGYWMIGDNQVDLEGPLREEQVKGRMIAFIRRGKTHSSAEPLYILYSHLWLMLRPVRKIIRKVGLTTR